MRLITFNLRTDSRFFAPFLKFKHALNLEIPETTLGIYFIKADLKLHKFNGIKLLLT
jgi:hypothetical protein